VMTPLTLYRLGALSLMLLMYALVRHRALAVPHPRPGRSPGVFVIVERLAAARAYSDPRSASQTLSKCRAVRAPMTS
jgi:hypothetical protein